MKVCELGAREEGAGGTVRWGRLDWACGRMTLAAGPRGVCRIGFGDEIEGELAHDWPKAEIVRDDAALAPLAAAVLSRGEVDVCVRGTPFQLEVWRELLRIPEGETISYGELAERVGHPGASRAVGSAVGANRIAWLIPCHRVVRGNGQLGGFRWGCDCKRAMLEHEWHGCLQP